MRVLYCSMLLFCSLSLTPTMAVVAAAISVGFVFTEMRHREIQ